MSDSVDLTLPVVVDIVYSGDNNEQSVGCAASGSEDWSLTPATSSHWAADAAVDAHSGDVLDAAAVASLWGLDAIYSDFSIASRLSVVVH